MTGLIIIVAKNDDILTFIFEERTNQKIKRFFHFIFARHFCFAH